MSQAFTPVLPVCWASIMLLKHPYKSSSNYYQINLVITSQTAFIAQIAVTGKTGMLY